MRSMFQHWLNEKQDIIYIRDMDMEGFMSVTNDADSVVEWAVEEYGNKRILYYDSMGQLDELVHDNGKFIGFKPGPRE